MTLPFTGIATFAKVPRYDPAESPAPHAAILGIPTDEATTQHPGARYGPRAIREASTQFPYYKRGRGYYDPERGRPMLAALELRDAGDVEIIPTLREENAGRIAEAVAALLARGIFPVCLGGDHSVTAAILPAFSGTPIHLVQIDAHLDFADRLAGAPATHASPMRRARELTPRAKPHPDRHPEHRLRRRGLPGGARHGQPHRDDGGGPGGPGARLVGRPFGRCLPHAGHRRLRPGGRPRHRLRRAGGLAFRDVARLVRTLTGRLRLRGMDLVEVNPYLDPSRRTAFSPHGRSSRS